MLRLLLPVGPGRTPHRAVAEAIHMARGGQGRVHLLSVQPRLSGHVAMCFPAGVLRQMHDEAGREELAPVEEMLRAAGVPFRSDVVVGRRAETIARLARDWHCDRVVLGPAQPPGLAGKVLGTLAQQVRHLLGAGGDCEVIGS